MGNPQETAAGESFLETAADAIASIARLVARIDDGNTKMSKGLVRLAKAVNGLQKEQRRLAKEVRAALDRLERGF